MRRKTAGDGVSGPFSYWLTAWRETPISWAKERAVKPRASRDSLSRSPTNCGVPGLMRHVFSWTEDEDVPRPG